MRFAFVLVGALLACARVGGESDRPDAVAVDAEAETSCPAATSGTYTCGGEARACDPNRPTGLPTGACAAGASCDVIVRPASCRCVEDEGPRSPYACVCESGAWKCTAAPPDGRVCGCSLNPPFLASCELPARATGTAERRWVGLDPINGTRTEKFLARVTLQGSSEPSAELRAAIVNSIRLFNAQQKTWVRADIELATDPTTFLAWSVRPLDLPVAGDWVLRVGPLPAMPGLEYVDGALIYCNGFAETHFTVLGE